jgi:hypothetical protein
MTALTSMIDCVTCERWANASRTASRSASPTASFSFACCKIERQRLGLDEALAVQVTLLAVQELLVLQLSLV